MRRNYDPKYMEKHRPIMPKGYQKKLYLRLLGVVSPSLRLINYDLDYEIKSLKWLCYKRKMSKEDWRRLRILLKVGRRK